MSEFKLITTIAASAMLSLAVGMNTTEFCDAGQMCRALVPELPHTHNDQRPGPSPQQIMQAIGTSSTTSLAVGRWYLGPSPSA
jgi:hypothetical protein